MAIDVDAKVDIWKNKLLDLGKRNKLISYKETKRSTLTITKPDMYSLWESFVIKENELIFPFYNDAADDDEEKEPKYIGVEEDYDVTTNQSVKELQRTLRNLRYKGNLSAEEQGINTLYLAFGFLKWRESENSEEYIMSPLVLVPVKLKLESVVSPFIMELHDDDIQSNPSLKYKIKNDFGIDIPEYEEDDNLSDYLIEVKNAINGNGWEIKESVGLGLFSFSKMNMYNDLEENRDKIIANPVIRAICGDASAVKSIPEELVNFDFDHEMKDEDVCQIIDADSSQQDALLCAKKGISFVLQGPPGTGKSQTITNIIAQAMADGKKVLFVAEKMAALDVVYKRLNEAKLGDFCLVLHNHRTNKKAILEQLEDSLKLAGEEENVKPEAYSMLYRLQEDRKKLNEYAEEVFRDIKPLNKSVYWANGQIANLDKYPDIIFKIEQNIRNVSEEEYNGIQYALQQYITSIKGMSGNFRNNPWRGTVLDRVTNEFRHDVGYKLPELEELLLEQETKVRDIFESSEIRLEITYNNIYKGIEVFDIAKDSPIIPVSWVLGDEITPLLDEISQWENRKEELNNAQNNLQNWCEIVYENTTDDTFHISIESITNGKIAEKYEKTIEDNLNNDSIYSLIESESYFNSCIKELKVARNKAEEIHKIKSQIKENFSNRVFKLEYQPILRRYRTEYTSILKYFKKNYKEDRNTIISCYTSVTGKMTDDIVTALLEGLYRIDEIKIEIAQECSTFIKTIGDLFLYEDTDFDNAESIFNTYRGLKNCCSTLKELSEILNNWVNEEEILQKHYEFLYDGTDTKWGDIRNSIKWTIKFRRVVETYSLNSEFVRRICSDKGFIEECNTYEENLSTILGILKEKLSWYLNLYNSEEKLENLTMKELAERIKGCMEGLALLEEWIDFENARKNCEKEGIYNYIENIEEMNLETEKIIPTFRKRFLRLWLDAVMDELPAIRDFRSANHMNIIEEFANLDKCQFKIARARIRSRLISNLPMLNKFTTGTDEVGILKRELAKKRKIMPLRNLFMKISHLIPMLKPCFMMSPLSVSLFLNTELYHFDTVIFDEASQVCTENAVGAILRGKQVIIAGDSRQLPPTNFFTSSASENDYDIDADDDSEEDNDAYESVLDEANMLPEKTLLWHYRSRHEHLIAFSNAKIYKNQLITFPSVTDKMKDNGVEYIYVQDGFYDRGGRKGNTVEAKKVAELVFEHFSRHPKRSLGVITFGEVQQLAIETALRKMRMENQKFEPFFNEEIKEPFFIKNLENVQGDERDTIIFSIGYAKDAAGVFRMNFGPLSKVGGERRLNVAITRAKYNVKLVGSIMPTDIHTDKISTEGPKLLRSYIEFAMNGIEVLQREIKESDTPEYDSPFEKAVYDFLDHRGYRLATQVGCSGYRIDLAVKHPTISGKYLLGIECDGASYHSARTARERDRLRQDILENMGWKIHRVWSTDWIKDPVSEGNKIIDAIEDALKNFSTDGDSEQGRLELQNIEEFVSVEAREVSASQMINPYDFAEEININTLELYAYNTYADKVKRLIEVMYPIHYDILCREIAPYMGSEKAGKRVKEQVNICLHRIASDIECKRNFYYPRNYEKILPRLNNPRRKIDYVSIDELAAAMYKVLLKSVGIEKEALCIETARAYNYNRMTQKISTTMEEAFNLLTSAGIIQIKNGKVEIK